MGGPSYTSIPGSERLRTRKRGESAAAIVEGADRTSLARAWVDVDGARVAVGRVVLQGTAVPLLVDVVDRLFPLLEAEELAVYVHLYRLALATEKNVCRVSRAELTRRTRLRDRRLGRAIAGLVEKRAVALIDRSRDGTLYRLHLDDDAAATLPPGPRLTTGTTSLPSPAKQVHPLPKPAAKKRAKAAATTLTTPLSATTTNTATATTEATAETTPTTPTTDAAPRSVGAVCAWFAARYGASSGRHGADVAAAVLELLEEGVIFARIPGVLSAFVERAPKTTPLRDLAHFVDLA